MFKRIYDMSIFKDISITSAIKELNMFNKENTLQ